MKKKKISFVLILSATVCALAFFLLLFFHGMCNKQERHIYSDRDYVGMADFLKKSGENHDALYHYRRALKINPRNQKANVALALDYYSKQENDRAIWHLQQIIAGGGCQNSAVFFRLGFAQYNQGYFYEAIKSLQEAIKLRPKNPQSYKWLGFSYLTIGELDKGHEAHEKAYRMKAEKDVRNYEWEGSDLRGKTLFIIDNIGMGDIFCFIRYAKLFKQMGAKVIFGVREAMIPILSTFPFIDECIPRIAKPSGSRLAFAKMPQFDEILCIDRIPAAIHQYAPQARVEPPYLEADPKLIAQWADSLSQDSNFKVGICWDARRYKNLKTGMFEKTRRAMPLHYFYPLGNIKGVSLYSLQQMNGQDQLLSTPSGFKINSFGETFDKKHGSFMDTAAVMKNLDLVITVDTSIAHLAGALGVPVWVILPYVPDWRWLLGRADTDLYPTMRLFRQKELGDWESAMKEVVVRLASIIADAPDFG